MFKKLVAASALALATSASFAQTAPALYAGADFGSTEIDQLDGKENSYGAFAGYSFNQHFALEAGVRRIFERGQFHANQTAFSALASLPVGAAWSVYGRLGYNRLGADGEHQSKTLYGAGLSYAFTPAISARLEYQKPHSDVSNVSAGMILRF
jgi:OOP family OmpA-OmpF porin